MTITTNKIKTVGTVDSEAVQPKSVPEFVSDSWVKASWDEFDLPTLVVEISSTTIHDDLGHKRLLYERLGIQEYWVVNAYTAEVFAFAIADGRSGRITRSQVLEGLEIAIVEEALQRNHADEDDGAIARWLLQTFAKP